MFLLPYEPQIVHFFGFREVDDTVGGVLEGQLAGGEVQDKATFCSGSRAVCAMVYG